MKTENRHSNCFNVFKNSLVLVENKKWLLSHDLCKLPRTHDHTFFII